MICEISNAFCRILKFYKFKQKVWKSIFSYLDIKFVFKNITHECRVFIEMLGLKMMNLYIIWIIFLYKIKKKLQNVKMFKIVSDNNF